MRAFLLWQIMSSCSTSFKPLDFYVSRHGGHQETNTHRIRDEINKRIVVGQHLSQAKTGFRWWGIKRLILSRTNHLLLAAIHVSIFLKRYNSHSQKRRIFLFFRTSSGTSGAFYRSIGTRQAWNTSLFEMLCAFWKDRKTTGWEDVKKTGLTRKSVKLSRAKTNNCGLL